MRNESENATSSKGRFTEAAVVVAAVFVVCLFVIWQLASEPVTAEAAKLQKDVAWLASDLEAVRSRMERLQARQEVLERERDILRQANRLLREQESERQAEMNRLQSELDFYRRLAGTGGAQEGLDVYRMELLATESPRVFRYSLTLTQNIRRASIISGRVRIDAEGILADRPVTLFWSQLSDGSTPEPAFRFKYFEQLEGYLTLPDGFSPTRLVISLEASQQRRPIQRSYDWQDLLVEDAQDAPAVSG
jgi:hypothetical protein